MLTMQERSVQKESMEDKEELENFIHMREGIVLCETKIAAKDDRFYVVEVPSLDT